MNEQTIALDNWHQQQRETTSLVERALHGAYAILFPQIAAGSITVWDYERESGTERMCAFLPGYISTVFGRDRTVFRRHPLCGRDDNDQFVDVLNRMLITANRRISAIEPIEAGGQILFLIDCEAL